MSTLAPLFEPISVGRLHLKNRIVMPAMHTMFANADGSVSDRLIAYHVERARGGVGLQILENTTIDWARGRANGTPARVDDDQYLPRLHDLTDAVHRAGGRIASQPHHSGRQNTIGNTAGRAGPVAPSPVACQVCVDEPEELRPSEIEALIDRFAEAVVRSRRAGFDAAELHGAHGYLIHQFVSPHTNRRTDAWGGSRAKRFRFALEVVRRSRAAVGPDFPLIYRISAEDRLPGGLELPEAVELAQALEAEGVDALHVTAGMYESMESIFMLHGTPAGGLLSLAEAIKRAVTVPVIAVGRLGHDPELAARAIEDGQADLVAFGRPLIAEPRLPELLRTDSAAAARPCVACNSCVGGLFNQWRATCVVNPDFGFEGESPPRGSARHVLVVGGGPAGLEAAARLAAAGCRVTLAEATGQLGGRLRAAAVPAHKAPEFPRLLAFLIGRVETAGVEVLLDTVADPALVAQLAPDEIVIATGGVPRSFAGRPTVDAAALLLGGGTDAASATVLGASQAGLDTALWLAAQGVRTVVADAGELPAPDANPILRDYLVRRLAEAGVTLALGRSPETGALDADLLVLAAGTVSRGMREWPAATAIGAAAIDDATLEDATASARDCVRAIAS